jgi:Fe-S-cluster containining protein
MKKNKRFKCVRCGECCKGTMRLNDDDIEKLESVGFKKENFVESFNGVNYMKTIADQCMWLEKEGPNAYFCRIYPFRPKICEIYPGSDTKNCQPHMLGLPDSLDEK